MFVYTTCGDRASAAEARMTLSFVLLVLILLLVMGYVRKAGTEELV